MAEELSRRHLLGLSAAGAAAVAGCADLDALTGSNDEAETESTAEADATNGTEDDGTNETNETADEDEGGEQESDDEVHEEYETTEVRAVTPDGEELGSVTAAIADTDELRYLGLSDTESLPADRGMLFVYEEEDERRFVMREMDFGIDIVYADADGTITEIHHAPEPGPDEDGEEQTYPGRGQYVLEVNYEWTVDHDVDEGDVLEFDLED